ncbi:CPBP family intramembrane glutamic endopeptidase [Oligoflexus tunisiensis]|uniref:CPBP family intramembrane glutamic endopeptidase n=1 Tax=Oligoflexus tunisiensis TaxID=708132 RepID=UPI001C404B96|nr:CPBP family intramembrane glutamic endopeptidase [Oligoflexus tunisiensis]
MPRIRADASWFAPADAPREPLDASWFAPADAPREPLDASWFAPADAPKEPQNLYWRPILSLFLPGLDQYAQGHTRSGLVYSSVWAGSLIWYTNRARKLKDMHEDMQWDLWTESQKSDFAQHEELPRQATLALQYTLSIGALSAWHSFRSGVETHRASGRFAFLEHEETPMDLLVAPFEFSHLQRKTTWIPLLVAAGLGAMGPNFLSEDYQRDPFSSADAFHTAAISYNAGVAEEALFRGYLQPLFYDQTHSTLWANTLQATLFALAHRGTVERPVAQAGIGFYLGWLQQKRNWTLSESIFIHTWWDVIALSSSYLVRLKDDKRGRAPPVIWLPGVSFLW